jgi:hypothetical protein
VTGPARTPADCAGRLRLIGGDLASTDLQVGIKIGSRPVAVVDAWYEDAAVAVEFDGRVEYTDPWRGRTPQQVVWNEKRRDDELRALDIRVVDRRGRGMARRRAAHSAAARRPRAGTTSVHRDAQEAGRSPLRLIGAAVRYPEPVCAAALGAVSRLRSVTDHRVTGE